MRRILHVAINDLRLMVSDKAFLFWTLAFPMFFIIVFGLLFRAGDPQNVKAELTVINRDKGRWGEFFIQKLKSPLLEVVRVDREPPEYNRLLVIPPEFSARIEAHQDQALKFKKRDGASTKAAAQAETALIQAITMTITELILYGDKDLKSFLDNPPEFHQGITVKSRFPEKTLTLVPSGFDHTIPGTTIQFIMMMVMIYGGVSVLEDRKRGILGRLLFSPLSTTELFVSKLLARLFMGLVQTGILVVVGKLFFHLNLGNPLLTLTIFTLFAAAMSGVSVLIGSICTKEEVIIGFSILLSNIFAALGGCWWPHEIVPQTVRRVALISPAYWAMDALHGNVFFHKGFVETLPHLGALLILTLIMAFLANRYFQVRE